MTNINYKHSLYQLHFIDLHCVILYFRTLLITNNLNTHIMKRILNILLLISLLLSALFIALLPINTDELTKALFMFISLSSGYLLVFINWRAIFKTI